MWRWHTHFVLSHHSLCGCEIGWWQTVIAYSSDLFFAIYQAEWSQQITQQQFQEVVVVTTQEEPSQHSHQVLVSSKRQSAIILRTLRRKGKNSFFEVIIPTKHRWKSLHVLFPQPGAPRTKYIISSSKTKFTPSIIVFPSVLWQDLCAKRHCVQSQQMQIAQRRGQVHQMDKPQEHHVVWQLGARSCGVGVCCPWPNNRGCINNANKCW